MTSTYFVAFPTRRVRLAIIQHEYPGIHLVLLIWLHDNVYICLVMISESMVGRPS